MTQENNYRDRRIHPSKNKEPKPTQILNRRMFAIVNRRHRPVYHKDGHLLIFSRKRDAMTWLETNHVNLEWRTVPLEISIIKA